jgi:hypothetical protein
MLMPSSAADRRVVERGASAGLNDNQIASNSIRCSG